MAPHHLSKQVVAVFAATQSSCKILSCVTGHGRKLLTAGASTLAFASAFSSGQSSAISQANTQAYSNGYSGAQALAQASASAYANARNSGQTNTIADAYASALTTSQPQAVAEAIATASSGKWCHQPLFVFCKAVLLD